MIRKAAPTSKLSATDPSDRWQADAALLEALRTGSRESFERLLDRYERRVFNLALRMLDCATDAEDATQEAFLEIHRSLPRFRGDASLDTWVHRITVNVCLQRRRKRRLPTVELPDEDSGLSLADLTAGSEDPFRSAAQRELRSALDAAVRKLPDGQREVVLLHGLQGLTLSEVAEVLSVPIGTVKSRLSTAFRRLRVLLAGPLAAEVTGEARQEVIR